VLDLTAAQALGVAGACGLVVGAERQWSGHASGPRARFAGVRTFFLVGLLGGTAGWLAVTGYSGLAALILAGGAALTVVAYWQATARRASTLDGTTEAAALVVLAIGVLAGVGHLLLAASGTAVVTLALGEKRTIHRFIHRIGEQEMRAALQFAVLALVVLPLLPAGPFGPLGGVRPRLLWTVVLIFSGLNFVGYVARRTVGDVHGVALAGMLGGMFSSTAVTLNYARASRHEPALSSALAVGVAGACAVLLVRVTVACLLLYAPVGIAVAPYLLLPFVAAGLGVALSLRTVRRLHSAHGISEQANPLGLRSAIQMTIALQVVLTSFYLVQRLVGIGAIVPSAALLGLTDVDALTLAITQFAARGGSVALAARAIGVGILANTGLKLSMALALGTPSFRRGVVWRLVLQAAVLGAALIVGLMR
jgi:uncharacterized membrane protein (DUF4010 family)